MNNRNIGKRVALTGILISLAMIFSYIESLLPLAITIPGVKLGVANIVVVIAMYGVGLKSAFLVNCMRVVAVGLLFTGAFGILYSMGGCVLSYIIMMALKKSGKFSIVGVSMAGGVFHNIGQIIIASLIVSSTAVFVYLPILIGSGIVTGIFIGFISREVLKRIESRMNV